MFWACRSLLKTDRRPWDVAASHFFLGRPFRTMATVANVWTTTTLDTLDFLSFGNDDADRAVAFDTFREPAIAVVVSTKHQPRQCQAAREQLHASATGEQLQ